jgi:uncharacterized protein (DUF58 family)
VSVDALLALRLKRRQRLRPTAKTIVAAGQRVSRARGRGVDFAEVRLYQPGDDVRSIDWRVTARKTKPHTKVFREERERPTLIVVDQTQPMFFGSRRRLKSVAAAELAARFAWRALGADDRVGGIVVHNRGIQLFKPYRNPHAVARFLGAVADANAALSRKTRIFDADLWTLVPEQISRLARVNQRVIVIGDLSQLKPDEIDALARVGRHNDTELIKIYDPLERSMPPANRYSVTDGISRVEFDSADAALRRNFEAQFEQIEAELRERCYRAGMRFTSVATDDDLTAAFPGL